MLMRIRHRIVIWLPKSRIVRSVLSLTAGTALGQLISIGVMPMVTRLYSPAEIGVISLFLSFLGFWSATISLRYEYALLVAEDDAESHIVHRLALITVFAMSLLGPPILWCLWYFNLFEFGLLPYWAPLVAWPIFLGNGVFMVYRSWALRARLISDIAKASIVRSSANAASRVSLGAMGGGLIGLFAAELAGACASILGVARATTHHFASSKPARIYRSCLIRVGKKYSKFAFLETPSAWVDALALTLPLPLVAMLYGPAAAGCFGLARILVSAPNGQVGAAVADVFQMELAKAVLDGDAARAKAIFYQLMRKMALFGLFPLGGAIALWPWVVPWVFGAQWELAGYAAAAIAPWLYASLIISPLSRLLSVLQVQEYKLIYDISAVLLLLVAFFVARFHELSFIQFLIAISLAKIIGYVVYAAILVVVMEVKIK